MSKINSLGRNKILKSKKELDEIFEKSLSFSHFPVSVVFILKEGNTDTKVAFSVSKKKFKKAVDRNRIKRLLREAYRLQQKDLKPEGLRMMWIYSGKKLPQFEEVFSSIKKLIAEINQKYGHA